MLTSQLTKITYIDVDLAVIDAKNQRYQSIDGEWFQEYDDDTWIVADKATGKAVRYNASATHGGGIVLQPVYEMIDGTWFSLYTGKEESATIS